jgi:hypothetical protein
MSNILKLRFDPRRAPTDEMATLRSVINTAEAVAGISRRGSKPGYEAPAGRDTPKLSSSRSTWGRSSSHSSSRTNRSTSSRSGSVRS